MEPGAASDVPQWHVVGTGSRSAGATSPSRLSSRSFLADNYCEGVLAQHIREGHYGEVRLDGLSLIGMGGFEGNIWGGAEGPFGLFIDERADERQHEALQMIFGGQAGAWPADFAKGVGEMHRIKVRQQTSENRYEVALDFGAGEGQYQIIYADPYQVLAPYYQGLAELNAFNEDDSLPSIPKGTGDFIPTQLDAAGKFESEEELYALAYDAPTMIWMYRKLDFSHLAV